jgi:hypothetical protein
LVILLRFAAAKHYVYIEAVANWDTVDSRAKLLEAYFYPSLKCVRRDKSKERRYGVFTDRTAKNMYNIFMKDVLSQNLVYWSSLFTTNTKTAKDSLVGATRDMKERFYNQLRQMRLEVIEEKLEGSSLEGPKDYITGKGGGGARKDDIWAAFCIAGVHAQVTIRQPGYENLSAE